MTDTSLLIVEDENELREIMVKNLDSLGVHISGAKDGNEAMEAIKRTRFDSVLCDVRMPGLDGISLLRKVREMGLDVPFIFLTGFAKKEEMHTALQLGAIDYLEKPSTAIELIRTILRGLEIGRNARRFDAKLASIVSEARPTDLEELEDYRRKISSLRARQ